MGKDLSRRLVLRQKILVSRSHLCVKFCPIKKLLTSPNLFFPLQYREIRRKNEVDCQRLGITDNVLLF